MVVFAQHGIGAVHWSTVGNPRAEDSVLMDWARANDHVVFTHDLDFGTMLALTRAESPSVIQIRTQDVTPAHLEKTVVDVVKRNASLLEGKALIVIDEGRSRVRILPLRRNS